MAAKRIHLTSPAIERLLLYVDQRSLESFVARTSPPWTWVPRILRAGAVTLGRNVAFREGSFDETTPRGLALIAHECVHVRQYREMGAIRFLVAYAIGAVRSGFAHERHPMEVDAIQLQRRIRAQLEAIRE